MATIRCAHCKGTHSTVAEVRACAAQPATATVATIARPDARIQRQVSADVSPEEQAAAVAANRAARPHVDWFAATGQSRKPGAGQPATERQVEYVHSLLAKHETPVAGKDAEEARIIARAEDVMGGKDISKAEASDLIEWLKEQPRKAQEPTTAAPRVEDHFTVEAGYYATASRTGNNDLDFWRVSQGKGRWEGRTFVQRVIGGQADVNVRGQEAQQALAAIVADPDAAARYGREIGRCYACNRHLTDETSRALGIGPDCRSK